MARQSLTTGAAVLCYINSKLYGLTTSFQWSSATTRKRIMEVDSVTPAELASTFAIVTGNIGILRQVGNSGIEGAGLTVPVDLLPQEQYFTIMLTERTSDSIIFRADFCSVTNQTWNVPTRGFVTGNVSFEALSWNVDGRS